jgi:stage II sporulation protein AB (anti-sigma F factor)
MEMALKNRLHMEFPSIASNVALTRVTLASFAMQLEFNLGELEEIRVAVSEAVSNAVIHAYPDEVGTVVVNAMIDGDTLEIEVIDEGRGIEDLDLARTPAFSTDPERMGLGLVFMESFMDQMNIESKPNLGTHVVMKKQPEREKNASHRI